MKTNHQRSFKEQRSAQTQTHRSVIKLLRGFKPGLASSPDGVQEGVYAKYYGPDANNGHRGQAKKVRGAKKFIRTRTRFKEEQALNKFVRESF